MADVRIKDLAAFSGTPTATDFLAIDGPNETKKIPGNAYALDNKTKLNVTQLGSGDDLDTLYGNDKSGFYYITNNVANAPTTYASMIVIARGTPTYQLVWNANGIMYRAYVGNPTAWTEWRKVLSNGENINIPYNVIIRSLYDRETDPPATVNGNALIFMDKDSERVGTIRVDRLSDGRNTLLIGVHNENANGDEVSTWLQLYVAKDGTVTYGIPSPEKFRIAIGLSTTSQTFTGEYISNSWYAKKNGNTVMIQIGNFSKVDAGQFRMNGVVPEGFRPPAETYFTVISKEAQPRTFSLTITPSGDMIFYNYNSAYSGVLTAGTVLTYIV